MVGTRTFQPHPRVQTEVAEVGDVGFRQCRSLQFFFETFCREPEVVPGCFCTPGGNRFAARWGNSIEHDLSQPMLGRFRPAPTTHNKIHKKLQE